MPLTDADLLSIPDAEERGLAAFDEYERCASDFVYWLRRYVHIQDATTEDTIRWEWWPAHEGMTESLREPRLIVLKARQVSWSWLLAAYALHGAQFRRNFNGLELSSGQLEASKLLGKSKFIWRHQPDWLRAKLETDNSTTLRFVGSGGTITALPATEDAGRSETASLVIVDEAAFHPYAAANYAAYKPAVDAGGQLIVVSTANGVGNWFHRTYRDARDGLNGFVARFWSWRARPGRDDDWYERQRQEFRDDPGKLQQEYPSSDAEAFLLSGGGRFDQQAIALHLERSQRVPALPFERLNYALREVAARAAGAGSLQVWTLPQPGQSYVLGSDVAEGLQHGDACCTHVLAVRTLEHVATLHGRWEPAEFAVLSDKLGRAFNGALWGIERNNHGHTVIHVAQTELHYPNLYWHQADETAVSPQNLYGRQDNSSGWRLGWPTTTGTKPGLIDDLAQVISAFALVSYDEEFWGECQTYVRLANGRTAAAEGCHDDRVMAMGIARRMVLQPAAQATSDLVLPPSRRYSV